MGYIFISLSIFYAATNLLFLQKENGRVLLSVYNLFSLAFVLVFSILFPISFYMWSNNLISFTYLDNSMIADFTIDEIVNYYFAIFITTRFFLMSINKFLGSKNTFDYLHGITSRSIDSKMIIYSALILLTIGVISDFLYLKVYGSFSNYMKYAMQIRAGIFTVSNPYSFFNPLRKCVIIASYILLSQYDNYKLSKHKIAYTIILVTSIVYSILVLISNGGRLSIGIYLLMIIGFELIKSRNARYIDFQTLIRLFLTVILLGFFIILFGTLVLHKNPGDSLVNSLINEISFIFTNFKCASEKLTQENYRYGLDFILFPVYFIPSSIWISLGIVPASEITTIFRYGVPKGAILNGISIGEMPADLITLSFMQFGYFGLFVLPLIYGFFYSKIFSFIADIHNDNLVRMFSLYLVVVGLNAIFYADPKNIVGQLFPFIVFMIVYKIVSLFKKNNSVVNAKILRRL